jgi:N-acyl-D-amino-acid deacylase
LDLILRGGRVVDGTGNPWFEADVAVARGRIAAIGDLREFTGRLEIDVRGCVVSPGFIDIGGPGAQALLADPLAEGALRQGVTTTAVIAHTVPVQDWLDQADRARPAVNAAVLVSSAALRGQAGAAAHRALAPDGLAAMKRACAQALSAGACGVAVELSPLTGQLECGYELAELTAAAGEHGGFCMALLPPEPHLLEEAVAEVLALSEQAGVPVHLGRLRPEDPATAARVLGALTRALARGIDLSADLQPFPQTLAPLAALLPEWAREGGAAAWRTRLADPEVRGHIRTAVLAQWGERVEQPVDALLSLMESGRPGEEAALFHLPDEVLAAVLAHPAVTVSSGCGRDGPAAFARFLGHYVRQVHTTSLEDGVRKLTSLPARRLGLWDRGLLRPGMAADLACFDPSRIGEAAADIPWVVVAGGLAVAEGEPTGARTGAVLRRSVPGIGGIGCTDI